ncbi:MAG: hypothetical protein ACHQ4H_14655 [Ktedonobacterales bacterium]
MMQIFRDFMRFIALVVGLVGALIALLINFGVVIANHVGGNTSHGVIGLVIVLIGAAGAIAAPFNGAVAALLLVISAVAFFFIAGPVAAFSAVLLLIAAALAFFDRSRVGVRAA